MVVPFRIGLLKPFLVRVQVTLCNYVVYELVIGNTCIYKVTAKFTLMYYRVLAKLWKRRSFSMNVDQRWQNNAEPNKAMVESNLIFRVLVLLP